MLHEEVSDARDSDLVVGADVPAGGALGGKADRRQGRRGPQASCISRLSNLTLIKSRCTVEFIPSLNGNKNILNFLFLARHVSLAFGTDYGCCWVQLGGTIALAQVSAYLSEPATTRPNEGILRCEIVWGPIFSPALSLPL